MIPRNGRLLVTYQENPVPELQLPGGGIDAGESPLQALYREVLEETGWKIGRPRRVGAFRNFTFMPEYEKWAEKVCLIYIAEPVRRLGAPAEKGHSAHWIKQASAARDLASPGDRFFVNRVLSKL
jgi:8-oxo-dGTP diphosphatase